MEKSWKVEALLILSKLIDSNVDVVDEKMLPLSITNVRPR